MYVLRFQQGEWNISSPAELALSPILRGDSVIWPGYRYGEASSNQEMSLIVQKISVYVASFKRITICEGRKKSAYVLITWLESENATKFSIANLLLFVKLENCKSESMHLSGEREWGCENISGYILSDTMKLHQSYCQHTNSEEYYLLRYDVVWSVECQLTFRRNISPRRILLATSLLADFC
jgi:hypothetical protein